MLQVLIDESLFNTLLTESMILSDPNEKLKDTQESLSNQALLCSASLAFSAKYLFQLICGRKQGLKNKLLDFDGQHDKFLNLLDIMSDYGVTFNEKLLINYRYMVLFGQNNVFYEPDTDNCGQALRTT